jgi:hypothetical protein
MEKFETLNVRADDKRIIEQMAKRMKDNLFRVIRAFVMKCPQCGEKWDVKHGRCSVANCDLGARRYQ